MHNSVVRVHIASELLNGLYVLEPSGYSNGEGCWERYNREYFIIWLLHELSRPQSHSFQLRLCEEIMYLKCIYTTLKLVNP
jgi:hypothetical protein